MEGKNPTESPQKVTLVEQLKQLYNIDLVVLSYEDVPKVAMKHFERQSSRFLHPDEYHERDFTKLFQYTQGNGDVVYVAQQDKTYSANGHTERLTYFVGTRDGEKTGDLELRYALTDQQDFFKDKPFVGFTNTEDDFVRQGLAVTRLEDANAYSLAEHGYLLHSGDLVADEAKGAWAKLIAAGKAEEYEDRPGKTRFRFLPA